MSFESKDEVKDAMNKYSVTKRYPYYWAKNCANMLRAKCSNLNKTCTWMAYFSIDNRSTSKKWVLKTLNMDHTCNPGWQIPSATTKWLVKNFFNTKTCVSDMKVAAMKEMVMRELQCDVSLEQMKKAKSMIRKLEKGDILEEYKNLKDYKAEILRSNEGNTCILHLQQPTPVFERIYVCFEACKRGFLEGCRRLIGIDGAFLKSEVKGEILTAVARDANNQMFPIAWAVVGSESKATWKWFLENLRDDLAIGRGNGWAFVSDQQKGLMPALYETLPEVEHRRCARHIYAIWRRTHPSIELQRQFWVCCKFASKREFERNLEVLKSLSEMGRPKKNRIKELGEFPRTGKLPKRGTNITCQLCFKKDHNKKGCPSKDQILQGTTTFVDDQEDGTANPPENNTLDEENNTGNGGSEPSNAGPSTLEAYFTDKQPTQNTSTDGVFQWRGQNCTTAFGLEKMRARNEKERNVKAKNLRKRTPKEVEVHDNPTGAREVPCLI
ncbi:unnamed protein product [Cuscuta europaea]|uniref:MULE transposase domain-containing protein n=1 Tax=Cuscuta europaea TaxID=41803 RepID=A0A9P0Z7N9_CUSEU|nr:unnamed protein product [Cuscuta europaea]